MKNNPNQQLYKYNLTILIMAITLKKEVYEELVNFAQSHPIQAIYKGIGMEQYYEGGKESPCYYFLYPNYKFDNGLEDKLDSLDLKINNELLEECNLMILPISKNSVKEMDI